MTGGGETAHVGADLGDDHLGGEVTDAGDGPQQPDRITEGVEAALHFRVDRDQRRRERVVLAEVDAEVERDLDPFRDAVRLLRTIPGVGDLAARAIVAEIGTDMGRFPTAGHLLSWAGLCPRNDESAGKRRSNRLRKGAPWLKTALVQCAWAASRKKDGYLRAQFQRLRQRRGPKKAICAVAASMLAAIWHMLRDGTFWRDLGPDHFHRRSPEQQAAHLARQFAKLGFACSITPQVQPVSV